MDYYNLFFILATTAGIVQLFGYWIYVQSIDGKVNAGSWLIWTLSAGVDLISYLYVTEANWLKSILPAACALACIVTFLFLLTKGHFSMPDKSEWGMVAVDTVISLTWWAKILSVIGANLMLQASTLFSAIPMIRGLLSGKETEAVRPWAIWTLAYTIHTAAICLALDSWVELAYPAANLVTHAAVLYFAYRTSNLSRRKR